MIFQEFKGKSFSMLDWTICKDGNEIKEYKDAYEIGDEYQIFGSDITGDILTIKNGIVTIISHENPTPENDYELTNELEKVKLLLEKLDGVPDYIDLDNIKDLKQLKKTAKECKKIAPVEMKEIFEDVIDEINDEIELLED